MSDLDELSQCQAILPSGVSCQNSAPINQTFCLQHNTPEIIGITKYYNEINQGVSNEIPSIRYKYAFRLYSLNKIKTETIEQLEMTKLNIQILQYQIVKDTDESAFNKTR